MVGCPQGMAKINSLFSDDAVLTHSAKDGLKEWFGGRVFNPADSSANRQSKMAKIEDGLKCSRMLALCQELEGFPLRKE